MNRIVLWFRSAVFHIAYGFAALGGGCITLFLLPLPRSTLLAWMRLWARVPLWLSRYVIGLSYKVEGAHFIPAQKNILIVSKHQSFWEIFFLMQFLEDPVFVFKHSLMHVPVFGLVLKKLGMLAVRRDQGLALKDLLHKARACYAHHRPIVIFPEATRTAPGAPPRYFPGVLFFIYSQLNPCIIPVGVNSGYFLGRRQFCKMPGCITVKFLPPVLPGMEKDKLMKKLQYMIESASPPPASKERFSCL